MPPRSKSRSETRIATTVLHGVGRAQRLATGEIVLPVHVHGDLHGLRVADNIAREILSELEAALDQRPPCGADSAKRRAAYDAPLAKPSGRLL